MKQYLELLKHVKDKGVLKGDRTGTGTKSVFGYQTRFDLRQGFPMVTTKKLHFKSIAIELLWLISGSTNIKFMVDNGCNIWNEWSDSDGELGDIYGKQWRSWETPKGEYIDQLTNVIERIKVKPDCRRLIVNAWNPYNVPDDSLSFAENIKNGKSALATCHSFFQLYSSEMHPNDRESEFKKQYADKLNEWDLRQSEYENKMNELNFPTRYLDLGVYLRSNDLFLGNPYNTASYALLMCMIGQEVNMIPKDLVMSIGDGHIYSNHFEQVDLQLTREPMKLPTIKLNPNIKRVVDFTWDDIELLGYNAHSHIKGDIAI